MEHNEERANAPHEPERTPSLVPTEPSPIPVFPADPEVDLDIEHGKAEPQNTSKIGHATPQFYCPMHCEGDKTYDSPGECPVCGMKLVEFKPT